MVRSEQTSFDQSLSVNVNKQVTLGRVSAHAPVCVLHTKSLVSLFLHNRLGECFFYSKGHFDIYSIICGTHNIIYSDHHKVPFRN